MLRDALRHFARSEIEPRVQRMDAQGEIDADLVSMCFGQDLMGIEVPEELGGFGGSFFDSILVVEELARVDPSVAVFVDVQNTLVNNAILRWGTREQKQRLLPRLARETVGAYSLSESGAGSDAFALSCRADRAEGGGWTLNGRKMWITNGAEAGIFLVFANADFSKRHRGITAFIVDASSQGLAVGKKEDKLGIRASSTTELLLDNVRVADEDVLGEAGRGYRVAIETLNEGRIGIGAQMVGLAQGALDHAIRYSGEREQFGRKIASFQAVHFQLADMATQVETARLLVYNAARLKEAEKPFMRAAAMAKYHASKVAQSVSSACLDLFGGYGFTTEYPVEKLYRDSKIGTIYEGTSNMQLHTIAKDLLQDSA